MTTSVQLITEFMKFAGCPLTNAQIAVLGTMDIPNGDEPAEGSHLSRDGLKQLILDHEAMYPDKGRYKVELRHYMLVHPPKKLRHDDHDEVLILAGTPGRY